MAKLPLFVLALFLQQALAFGEGNLIDQFKRNRPVDEDKVVIDAMKAEEINAQVDQDGQTALFYSRHLGTTLLLLAGANPNIANHAGRTPAFRAVSRSHDVAFPIMLDLLLLAHADVNARDTDGISLLAWAAHEDNLPAAKLLLLLGADPAPADVRGDRTPLFFASQQPDTRMTDLLNGFAADSAVRPKRADADTVPEHKLESAARAARLLEVSAALAAGADINARDKDGATGLFRAVAERRAAVAALLLLKGADPNVAKDDGTTPLMQCVAYADMASERMLVDLIVAGANVNATAKDGTTALSMSVHCSNNTAAQWMIWRGADLNVHSPDGTLMQGAALHADWPSMVTLLKQAGLTAEPALVKNQDPALFDAVRQGTVEDVEAELKKGIPVDVPNRYDQTALEWAVCYNRSNVIDLLLRHGADINHQHNSSGENILHTLAGWKTETGVPPATRIENLIKLGANPNLVMHDGCTPLMVAAREGAPLSTVEYLVKVTENVNARDKQGLTALGLARQHGHAEIVKLLTSDGAPE